VLALFFEGYKLKINVLNDTNQHPLSFFFVPHLEKIIVFRDFERIHIIDKDISLT